jgi:hypothetical protein
MKNGDNKAYTEAIRLFNENKIEKLEAWIEEHN